MFQVPDMRVTLARSSATDLLLKLEPMIYVPKLSRVEGPHVKLNVGSSTFTGRIAQINAKRVQ